MLILTRKRSETIQIGDEITIKVIRTGRNTVKLGIDAPAHIRVLRGELTPEPTTLEVAKVRKGVLELSVCTDLDLEQCSSDQFPHPHIA